ncbi:hypothetical protein NXS19_012138 [Fusarium pseudograminearum]|nr:hypothetical protein NXS19_012138 [Fusarium pseudograminearum]
MSWTKGSPVKVSTFTSDWAFVNAEDICVFDGSEIWWDHPESLLGAFTHCNTEPQQCLSFSRRISGLKPLVLRCTTVTPYTLIERSAFLTPTIDWTLAAFLGSSSISLNLELAELQLGGRVWGKNQRTRCLKLSALPPLDV